MELLEDVAHALERVAPGLERGLPLEGVFGPAPALTDMKLDFKSLFEHDLNQATSSAEPSIVDEVAQTIESFTFVQNSAAKPQSASVRKEFARRVDLNKLPEDWPHVVPELARAYPFELDPFQKQAIYHLERGESVFVAAHTSAGKTVVAEYAIALAQNHLTKAIYTSPIKALSNQKFRDFTEEFESVGLLTGDIQLNPDASCLIMTTEILRSMLYRGAPLIQDVEFVIFDEVHYVNDQERGVVWEEVIIMLPPHVQIIMLSATTPNNFEFADWVGRTRGGVPIYVISTLQRPVPLEHFLFTNRLVRAEGATHRKLMYKLVDAQRRFHEAAFSSANASLDGQGKGATPSAKTGLAADAFRNVNQEKNVWTDVVYFLEKRDFLPAVAFTFSKRKCDENADHLRSLDLSTASEKAAIHIFLANSLGRLKGSDAELPQIVWLKDILSRGIGVHHSGLLPLLKEAVEILFSRGLVKVLFATETFAMGVNMPARTVLFSSLRKHDGTAFRFLLPGEYTQMAGRAGRRGKDSVGTVIILCSEAVPGETTLRQVILGQPTKLSSQFRLTYQMILSLLRIESLRVEEMLKKSFAENHAQQAVPEQEAKLQQHRDALQAVQALECAVCAVDLEECYEICRRIRQISVKPFNELLRRHSVKHLPMGSIVLVDLNGDGGAVSIPVIAIKPVVNGETASLLCAIPDQLVEDSGEQSLPAIPIHVLPFTVEFLTQRLTRSSQFKFISVPAKHLVRITTADKVKVSSSNLTSNGSQFQAKDVSGILAEFRSILHDQFSALVEDAKLPQFSSVAGGFEFDEAAIIRKQLLAQLQAIPFTCMRCPKLQAHYSQMHQKKMLTDKLAQLQFALSEDSLHLLPEYEARVRCLVQLSYVTPSHTVLVKGRVACEINTVDPLLLTELLFENAFGDAEPAEIAAVLAGLVFQERSAMHLSAKGLDEDGESAAGLTIEEFLQRLLIESADGANEAADAEDTESAPAVKTPINATPRINKICLRIVSICRDLATTQRDQGLAHLPCASPLSNMLGNFNPALVHAVYQWCCGASFLHLTTQVTAVAEGSIVRCLTRLDETCREVAGAGKIMGESELVRKAEEAGKLLRRDICFMSSLYL